LSHHKAEDTSVTIGFLDPTSNRTHILKTATERLNRLVLPAPVIRLTLNANVLAPIERNARDLFKKSHAQAHSIEQVMDNLAARLGRDALYIAMPDDDHRPEKAWLAQVLSDRHPSFQWPARPLWLYPVPQLANRPLTVISAVERIENGWWGSIDVRVTISSPVATMVGAIGLTKRDKTTKTGISTAFLPEICSLINNDKKQPKNG